MSNIKLTYFNGRGRGETARLILAFAGKDYEDRRISFGKTTIRMIIILTDLILIDDMPSIKPSLPYGQVPVLEVDGVNICQSMAIARFLANEYGLTGNSSLVKAQIDEVVDVINDVQNAMVRNEIMIK